MREPLEWVPEASRRARGFAVWAAVASPGRAGIAELVDRDCDLATRFATRLGALPDTEILNDVVLNQVLVRFTDPDGDHDGRTRRVTARLQADGTMWVGPTFWQGRTAMRVSVSGWSTTEQDVDMAVAAVARAAAATDR